MPGAAGARGHPSPPGCRGSKRQIFRSFHTLPTLRTVKPFQILGIVSSIVTHSSLAASWTVGTAGSVVARGHYLTAQLHQRPCQGPRVTFPVTAVSTTVLG